jgi:Beta-propeller repeat
MLLRKAAGFSTRTRWIAGLSAIALLGGSLVFGWPGKFRQTQPQSTPATNSPARLRPIVPAERTRVAANFGNLPLSFEPNQGQTDAQVKFLSRTSQYNLFLTPNEAVFTLPVKTAVKNPNRPAIHAKHSQMNSEAVLRMELKGANAAVKVTGEQSLSGHTNYLIGRDSSKWVRDIPQYARVNYQNVYPNVDLTFYGQQRHLEFDFVVKPGADPAAIALGIEGAKNITTEDGDLVLASAAGDLRVHKPIAYQKQGEERQPVEAHFIVKGAEVALGVGSYDHSRELVIDPTIVYGTYLGAGSEDDGSAIVVDSTGAAYITGQTASPGFPLKGTPVAPLVGSLQGTFDAFITKLSSDGTALVYSTFFGGTGTDSGNAIAVDGSGQAYVAGSTNSPDIPPVGNSLQPTAGGGQDAFVAVLNAAGNTLVYTTYIGGLNDDFANGIAVKGSVIYVAGSAGSDETSFPIIIPSGSILQANFLGGSGTTPSDAFVTKIDLNTPANNASVFLGGTANDEATGISVDGAGNAYITGVTFSTDFPHPGTPFQNTCNGCTSNQEDSFVTEITADFKGYGYSTFLGGSGGDDASQVVADASGNAYVVGVTNSTDFPTNGTNAPFKNSRTGSNGNAFVTVVKAGGASLLYSTYLGGTGLDTGLAIALDTSSPPKAFVTGQTSSTDFPTTSNATQPANAGGNDAFVSEINPNVAGTPSLVFSTYLGGGADEDHFLGGIAVDSNGNFYVTGDTQSVSNFPVVPGSFKTTMANSGGSACTGVCRDAFVVKYSQNAPQFSITAGTVSPGSISRGSTGTSTVTVTSSGASGTVNLGCFVSSAAKPPTCSLSPTSGSLTASGTVTSTLTITTVSTGSANLTGGAALWLPIPGIALLGAGFIRKDNTPRKWAWSLFCSLALTGLLLMMGCGSGNGGGGGGGGGGGTTTGSYTVTVTGSIVGTGSQSANASFSVQ